MFPGSPEICTMRITGLEPARQGHQNLNLARLPIPPYPLITEQKAETPHPEFPPFHSLSVRGFEPRTT